ncbi:MAG: hypothetical protein UIK34_05445 [Christensenellales bacterium]|jgi:ABC-type transporter Mla subunit MlaD|nr:hypothetical protein [Christensenellales bacterium]
MAHEILSVKLCQLDERMERLHSRIHISETACQSRLQQEIDALAEECDQAEATLRESLARSKSGVASVLSQGYDQVGQIIRSTKDRLQSIATANPDQEAAVEEKILLAEYALDFAHQAADRALLLCMDAINAQMFQQEEGRSL